LWVKFRSGLRFLHSAGSVPDHTQHGVCFPQHGFIREAQGFNALGLQKVASRLIVRTTFEAVVLASIQLDGELEFGTINRGCKARLDADDGTSDGSHGGHEGRTKASLQHPWIHVVVCGQTQ
jgi:hypothetical protein